MYNLALFVRPLSAPVSIRTWPKVCVELLTRRIKVPQSWHFLKCYFWLIYKILAHINLVWLVMICVFIISLLNNNWLYHEYISGPTQLVKTRRMTCGNNILKCNVILYITKATSGNTTYTCQQPILARYVL